MNALARQLAQISSDPDDRDLLDRIASKFSHVDDNGCVFLHGGKNSNGRPQIGINYRKLRVARFIVACRDDLDMRDDWDACHTCNVKSNRVR